MSEGKVVILDARPYLRKKLEPFQLIMDAVASLDKEEVLLLHATFKPTPLLGLMKMKGYVNRSEMAVPGHWITAFVHKSQGKERLEALRFEDYANAEEQPEEPVSADAEGAAEEAMRLPGQSDPTGTFEGKVTELDNRGLEPPQPMVRTLQALEKSEPGDRVVIHNDRVPMFLIEELQRLGYPYGIEEQKDGSAKVAITKVVPED